VDHLCLHTMIKTLGTPDNEELRKLQQLKDELVSQSATHSHLLNYARALPTRSRIPSAAHPSSS
jgi:hypothetical protein